MNLKGDHNTKAQIAKRIKIFAKALREEALSVANIPQQHPGLVLAEQFADLFAEAAQKSYAANILDTLVNRLEVEAKLMRYPKLKCSFCGGDAHVCYPRHLEGKSCG
jgi:hypothetical protein